MHIMHMRRRPLKQNIISTCDKGSSIHFITRHGSKLETYSKDSVMFWGFAYSQPYTLV